MIRDVASLIAAIEAGEAVKWVLFWGHRPERDGGVGKGCLSQWWPCTFTVDGETFASAEHWMMAAKARLFGDEVVRAAILRAKTPGEAKALGREVRGFRDDLWVAHRFDLVVAGNVHKFGQNPALRAWLAGTRGRVLVEASPQDRIWGIGLAASDRDATRPQAWRGLNLLGFALMEARHRLEQGDRTA